MMALGTFLRSVYTLLLVYTVCATLCYNGGLCVQSCAMQRGLYVLRLSIAMRVEGMCRNCQACINA
jgi:hypothetical protein